MDVSPFQRVLVAGFVAGGTDDVDTNQETVRLLRSQLRSKSSLKVIDADVMPLIDIAQDQSKPAAVDDSATAAAAGQTPALAERRERRQLGRRRRDGASEDASRKKRTSSRTSGSSRTPRTGRSIGEEYQNPLIVTGTVLFTPQTSSSDSCSASRKSSTASAAAASCRRARYMERKGFILRPKFVFIDGRTGATMYSETLSRRDPVQRAAEHAGAVVLLRADGPARAELPERAQQPEDPRHARSPQLVSTPVRPTIRPPRFGSPRARKSHFGKSVRAARRPRTGTTAPG